jgi:hypothetical protein
MPVYFRKRPYISADRVVQLEIDFLHNAFMPFSCALYAIPQLTAFVRMLRQTRRLATRRITRIV